MVLKSYQWILLLLILVWQFNLSKIIAIPVFRKSALICTFIALYSSRYQQVSFSLIIMTSQHYVQWEASVGGVDQWAVGAAAVVYWPWLDERHVYKVMTEVSVCHNARGRYEEREGRSCSLSVAVVLVKCLCLRSLVSSKNEREKETERYDILYKTLARS